MFGFLYQRKQAKAHWLQDLNDSIVYNLNNVRHEASRLFRNKNKEYIRKLKLMNVKLTARSQISETCIGVSMILRSYQSIIQYGMRRAIWLQTVTVFWLGEGTISLSCSMYMGLVLLGT